MLSHQNLVTSGFLVLGIIQDPGGLISLKRETSLPQAKKIIQRNTNSHYQMEEDSKFCSIDNVTLSSAVLLPYREKKRERNLPANAASGDYFYSPKLQFGSGHCSYCKQNSTCIFCWVNIKDYRKENLLSRLLRWHTILHFQQKKVLSEQLI